MPEVLSPEAQRFFDTLDVDAWFYEWQIPAAHNTAFMELVRKNYLIKVQDDPVKYVFAQNIVAAKDQEMRR